MIVTAHCLNQIMFLLPIITLFVTSMSSYELIHSPYPNNSIAKHYCGSSLSGALLSVCKKSGFVAHFPPRVEFNRRTRGIIDECCMNPCSKDQLMQYCQKKIARISIFKKRRRSDQHFIETNKISKSKRSPRSCTCRSRAKNSTRISKQNSMKNRKRFTKDHQKKKQFRRSSSKAKKTSENTTTTTTESQAVAEAIYWTGDDDGLFFITRR